MDAVLSRKSKVNILSANVKSTIIQNEIRAIERVRADIKREEILY